MGSLTVKRAINMRNVYETALLIALLFKRSEKNRVRISHLTVRKLAERERLKSAFIGMLINELDGLGIIMIELERAGFGLIPVGALNGAPSILANTFLKDDLQKLRKEELNFGDILREIEGHKNSHGDEDY